MPQKGAEKMNEEISQTGRITEKRNQKEKVSFEALFGDEEAKKELEGL